MNRPFRVNPGGAALLAEGFESGVNSFAKNFFDMRKQGTFDQLADIDTKRQEADEAFTMGAYGAQQKPLGAVRDLPDSASLQTVLEPSAADLASQRSVIPSHPGVESTDAKFSPVPQSFTPQKGEGSKLKPDTAEAYRRAGQASVQQKQIYAQLRGELDTYRKFEQAIAQVTYDTKDKQTELEVARSQYGLASPEALAVEAQLARIQSSRQHYEAQLKDFREAVLDLSSHRDPQSGERVVDEAGLHEALMMWLDKRTTTGQRGGLEEGMLTRLPSAAVLQRPRQREVRRPTTPRSHR